MQLSSSQHCLFHTLLSVFGPVVRDCKIPYIVSNATSELKLVQLFRRHAQKENFVPVRINNDVHLCVSPLKKGRNIKQINKILSLLKIKKGPRPSPNVSATFYKEGDFKIGNNNKIWTISKGKWKEIKEELITVVFDKVNNKMKKMLRDVPRVGMHGRNPVFMVSNKGSFKNPIYTIITLKSLAPKK